MQLAISDAHQGLKAAIARVLSCPWQRCTVHFLRDCLGHARKDEHGVLAALVRPIFNADSHDQARERLTDAVAHLDGKLSKVARLLEDAEPDILAFYHLPQEHWRKLRSTNPLERLNREIGRRTDVVGIFTDDNHYCASPACSASNKTTNGSSAAATYPPARWSRCSSSGSIEPNRRCSSSKRPETPTHLATNISANSYTTPWDLTAA